MSNLRNAAVSSGWSSPAACTLLVLSFCSCLINLAEALKKLLAFISPLANCERNLPKWCSMAISDNECALRQHCQSDGFDAHIRTVVAATAWRFLRVCGAIENLPRDTLACVSFCAATRAKRSCVIKPVRATSHRVFSFMRAWTAGAWASWIEWKAEVFVVI